MDAVVNDDNNLEEFFPDEGAELKENPENMKTIMKNISKKSNNIFKALFHCEEKMELNA